MKQKFGQRSLKPKIENESYVLTFGKHKGKTVEWVLAHEPSYLVWLDDNKYVELSQELYNTAEEYAAEEDEDYGIDMWDFMAD